MQAFSRQSICNWRGNLLSKSGIDTTLGGDSVRTGREKLGDTSSVEASLGQTKGSTQTGTTGTNDNGIVLVVLLQSESDLHPLIFDAGGF
jgi:hypothetical protein